jgi:hypothetical protein
MDHGILLVKLPQQDGPALLISTTHTASDLLSAATLKNVGPVSVSAYRLGWVVTFPTGNSEVHLSERIDVPAGVKPGATWNVAAQSVSPEYAKQDAAAVAFFVAEVYPSTGEPWKADLIQMRQEARNLATLQLGAKRR